MSGHDPAYTINQESSGSYRDEGGRRGPVQVRSSSVSSLVAESLSLSPLINDCYREVMNLPLSLQTRSICGLMT